MEATVQAFFTRQAQLASRGECHRMAAAFVVPFPVYVNEIIRVVATRDDLAALLQAQFERAAREGMRAVSARVMAQGLPRSGRFQVWVEWTRRDGAGRALSRQPVRYFCRTADGGFLIELAELGTPTPCDRPAALLGALRYGA